MPEIWFLLFSRPMFILREAENLENNLKSVCLSREKEILFGIWSFFFRKNCDRRGERKRRMRGRKI